MRRDVVDGLTDGLDLLSVLVGDLDPELVLELHDQLHEVERIRIEILLEGCFLGDLALLDTELLGQEMGNYVLATTTETGDSGPRCPPGTGGAALSSPCPQARSPPSSTVPW